jgi:hypothetical protein
MESSLILGRCRKAHPGFSTTAWEIEAKLVLAPFTNPVAQFRDFMSGLTSISSSMQPTTTKPQPHPSTTT